MVIVFIVYMIYHIRKGHHIADLLQPHHEAQASVLDGDPEKDTWNTIVRSQRFSVRSSRYAGSIRSTFSRRTQGNGISTRSPYQQFNNAYYVKPYKAPPPRSRSAPLVPLPTKTDLKTSTNLPKPALAHLDRKSLLSVDAMSSDIHGVAEEVVLRKPDAKHLTVTYRPVSPYNSAEPLHISTQLRPQSPLRQQITVPDTTFFLSATPASPTPSLRSAALNWSR